MDQSSSFSAKTIFQKLSDSNQTMVRKEGDSPCNGNAELASFSDNNAKPRELNFIKSVQTGQNSSILKFLPEKNYRK